MSIIKALRKTPFTNDALIRGTLCAILRSKHAMDPKVRIIEELGVRHGSARVDIAVVNGVMHGYEIKSDLDTLQRLPEQVRAFSDVFDKMTLVVGKTHLRDALMLVPDWWDVMIAKIDSNDNVILQVIREGERNPEPNTLSMARLLWREEAIRILEQEGAARGFYSKPRDCIYKKLTAILDHESLAKKVREIICVRDGWRVDAPLMTNGG